MRFCKKLPVLLQSEWSECGLVALAMIALYHGIAEHYYQIKSVIKISLKGTSVFQIKKFSEQLGLRAQVLRIEVEQLKQVRLPCIAYWNMNHFVVIKKIQKQGLILHDPSVGVRRVSFFDAQYDFTGIIIELMPSGSPLKFNLSPFLPVQFRELFHRNRYLILLLISLSIILQFCAVSSMLLFKHIVDTAGRDLGRALFVISTSFFSFKLVECGLKGMRTLFVSKIGSTFNQNISILMIKHIFSLPISFFEGRHKSNILAQFNSIERVRHLLTESMIEGMLDGIFSVITLLVLFVIESRLALIVLGFSLLLSIGRLVNQSQFYAQNAEYLSLKVAESTYLSEAIQTISPIKIFGQEKNNLSRWQEYSVDCLNAFMKLTYYKVITDAAKTVIHGLDLAVILFFGSGLLYKHEISIGAFYAFVVYRQQFISAFGSLEGKVREFQVFKLHLNRINDAVSLSGEVFSSDLLPCLSDTQQRIQLKNLSFSYLPDEPPIFQHVDLIVSAGQLVVIKGASGCGKSTLFKILTGLLQPTTGALLYNQIAIYPSYVKQYRQQIAAVLQNDILLSGTICENVCFFDPDPDERKIVECIRSSEFYDELSALPMGINTLVGEGGSLLSAGQKQRVLLARALYSNPKLLFLDEATCHLDLQKEAKILTHLKNINLTTIITTHRPETLKFADQIFCM